MLRRIFGIDNTLRKQSKQVREIATEFRLKVFPEILEDLQYCPICNKPQLLVVRPDLICYSCFIDAINQAAVGGQRK